MVAVKLLRRENVIHKRRYDESAPRYLGHDMHEDGAAEIAANIYWSAHPHDNLMVAREVLCNDQWIYLILDMCDQGDAFTFAMQDPYASQFNELKVKGICAQLVRGVQHCHSHNIAHQDVSLENFMCTADRTEGADTRFVLSDFGQARFIFRDPVSGSSLPYNPLLSPGKLNYQSNEVFYRNHPTRKKNSPLHLIFFQRYSSHEFKCLT
jgi:serine/threonine protein kinase